MVLTGRCFRQDNLFTAFRLLWKSFPVGAEWETALTAATYGVPKDSQVPHLNTKRGELQEVFTREPSGLLPLGSLPGLFPADQRFELLALLLFSHSMVSDFATPWTAARQASLSFTISGNLLKPLSIESVIPSSHLSLCQPLLLLPSIFSSIWIFFNESALRIRWPKYWSFSFTLPMNIGALLPTEKSWALPPQEAHSLALIWNKL